MTSIQTEHNDLLVYLNFSLMHKLELIDDTDMRNVYDWAANGEDCE